MATTPAFLLGESRGQSSLAGHGPWGHRESDTTDVTKHTSPHLEKVMAPHSTTLAWKIPWMVEPGRLQSMGLQRVGHD